MAKGLLEGLEQKDDFIYRHIGPSEDEIKAMLSELGVETLDELIDETLPESIRFKGDLNLGNSESEQEVLKRLRTIAKKNKVYKTFIGMGYYNTNTPNVILRNILENPGWYTAYTPYQAEISQGRLEALLNFQQMVMDLSGLDFANASLLDEATAAAEAMAMLRQVNKNKRENKSFFVANDVHPQTLDVIKTRAEYLGFEIVTGDPKLVLPDIFGALFQYPSTTGELYNIEPFIKEAHEQGALAVVASDLLSLCLLKPPGEMGADVVIGNSQRFGVPMGFGGPHAAFFATKNVYKRLIPGRVIGTSVDSRGNIALRMALQTREQHIRREKATSNICTAQALLAEIAGFYAVYHGPRGLKSITSRVYFLTTILAKGLKQKGLELLHDSWFDTITIKVNDQQTEFYQRALEKKCNLRLVDNDKLGISLDETTSKEDVLLLWQIFLGDNHNLDVESLSLAGKDEKVIPENLKRTSEFLTHPVFNSYHSETNMLRYLKRLENKDYSLIHGMIPLGSCTMKLNATTEMTPITWPEFANIHPFVPKEQAQGYLELISELEQMLMKITGYDAFSMQPNSGAQGEYAGLLAIRRYYQHMGEDHRDICLIPSSAHGTNPASASMIGLKIVVIKTDREGNIDLEDLKAKAKVHSANLCCLMITYPSTHGVFEETVAEVCGVIHTHGGQVYMDGANLNAQMGITKPTLIGSDVSHLNLHKTFCIPHGGGGPGVGPIGVKAHLEPFLPNHVVSPVESVARNSAVAAAPYGSALILTISWTFIKLMGDKGLKKATQVAILNANYIAKRLSEHYDVLYHGRNNRVAHECIIDLRLIKEKTGITEEDVAKRLIDYGFHAPTMSWPVPSTLMIEPTESESKAELDHFCDALISIRQEVAAIESGEIKAEASALHHAPHTLVDIVDASWQRSYSREQAVFPSKDPQRLKFWPTVNRIDNVYGDRNFSCSCAPIEAYVKTAS